MRTTLFRAVGSLLLSVTFLSNTVAHAIVEPDRAVRDGEAKWNVHISEDFGDEIGRQLVCSGALIAPRVVITAAHCVFGPSEFDTWVLRIGYSSTTSNDGATRRPAAIVYHAKFERALTQEIYDDDWNLVETIPGEVRPGENDFDSDIAIILLDRAVNHIAPLPLPSSSDYQPIGGWRTYGWGITGPDEDLVPTRLQTAAQDDHTAALAAEFSDPMLHVYAAVATHKGRTSGTCWGDSGGPLIDKRGVLIGLTSFSDSEICAEPVPTVFTKVSSFLTWIDEAKAIARNARREYRTSGRVTDEPRVPVIAYEPATEQSAPPVWKVLTFTII